MATFPKTQNAADTVLLDRRAFFERALALGAALGTASLLLGCDRSGDDDDDDSRHGACGRLQRLDRLDAGTTVHQKGLELCGPDSKARPTLRQLQALCPQAPLQRLHRGARADRRSRVVHRVAAKGVTKTGQRGPSRGRPAAFRRFHTAYVGHKIPRPPTPCRTPGALVPASRQHSPARGRMNSAMARGLGPPGRGSHFKASTDSGDAPGMGQGPARRVGRGGVRCPATRVAAYIRQRLCQDQSYFTPARLLI